ncbi:hypothetical protein GDO86_010078 [Hymenochirus boettgeri]|uniref:Uncharacterized protein n=1 Tax=Hymenochirus boettgeri TaxID=247094 RepID=A0A8T2JP27_9PIPI|nr:hypothetical protein GDO86_010078 [Hymenochirus boettgeri]
MGQYNLQHIPKHSLKVIYYTLYMCRICKILNIMLNVSINFIFTFYNYLNWFSLNIYSLVYISISLLCMCCFSACTFYDLCFSCYQQMLLLFYLDLMVRLINAYCIIFYKGHVHPQN